MALPIMVHAMGPCSLDGYGLPYAFLLYIWHIIHLDKVLGRCGYAKWSFKRVRDCMGGRKQEGGSKKKTKEETDRDTKTTSDHSLRQRSFGSPEPDVLPSRCNNSCEVSFDPQEDVGTQRQEDPTGECRGGVPGPL